VSVNDGLVHDFKVPFIAEPLRSRGVVRLRTQPARKSYTFHITTAAQDSLHDKLLSDAVRRVFDQREFVRSLVLDRDFPVIDLDTVTQTNRVLDQVFERAVVMTISVLEWMPQYKDVPMVLSITHRVRPFCDVTNITEEPESLVTTSE